MSMNDTVAGMIFASRLPGRAAPRTRTEPAAKTQ